MKKITLGLLALALASGVNAKGNFEGWYLGADIHSTSLSLTELSYPYSYHYTDIKGNEKGNKKTGVSISGGFGWSYGSSNIMTQIETKYRTGGSTISANGYDLIKEDGGFSLSWLQGYRVAEKFLPYIKIGGAVHNMKGDGVIFNDGGVFGITYGAGLKYAVTENIETGVEFTQTQLRDVDSYVKFKANTLNFGVSYRF